MTVPRRQLSLCILPALQCLCGTDESLALGGGKGSNCCAAALRALPFGKVRDADIAFRWKAQFRNRPGQFRDNRSPARVAGDIALRCVQSLGTIRVADGVFMVLVTLL